MFGRQQCLTRRLDLAHYFPTQSLYEACKSTKFAPREATPAAAAAAAQLMTATMEVATAGTAGIGRRPSVRTCGFVGENTLLASEYHSCDFDWQQHALETAPLLEAQWSEAPVDVRQAAPLDSMGRPLSAVAALLQQLNPVASAQHPVGADIPRTKGTTQQPMHGDNGNIPLALGNSCEQSKTTGSISSNGADAGASAAAVYTADPSVLQPRTSHSLPVDVSVPPCSSGSSINEWEVFYRAHPSAKFFKERRYLLLEFPCLAASSQLQHVVEIGAGCGSSILPVLRAHPHARATLSDISSTCLQQLVQAMEHLGLDTKQVEAFTADGTSPDLGHRLAGCAADVVLIMFTLSAVEPEGMLGMMRNAAAALRPGGLLCIRDHALYDMVRFKDDT